MLQLATTAQISQIYQIDLACQINYLRDSTDDSLSNSSSSFWTEEAYLKECLNPNSCLLCLVNAQEVLGFGCLWSVLEEAHIIMLAVLPKYQRRGLGQYLTWGLLHWASQRGLEWATLEVRESNLDAIALYRDFGFTEIGKRSNYYAAPIENAVVMWRKGLHKTNFQQDLNIWKAKIYQKLANKGYAIEHSSDKN